MVRSSITGMMSGSWKENADDDSSESETGWRSPAAGEAHRYRSKSPEYARSPHSARATSAVPGEAGAERQYAQSPGEDRSAGVAAVNEEGITSRYISSLEEARAQALQRLEELSRALNESQMQNRRANHEYRSALLQAQTAAADREQELCKVLSETEARLAVATNDLANLRSLTGTDKADPQALMTLFDDINDAVAEFAFRLIDDLPFGDDVVTPRHLKTIERACRSEFDMLYPFLQYATNTACQITDAMVYASQTVFLGTLQARVFDRFAALQKTEHSRYLLDLEAWVQKEVSQEQSARWRAVTYKAAENTIRESDIAGSLTHRIFAALADILRAFSGSKDYDPEALLQSLYEDALKITHMALKLHDQSRTAHLLFDYTMFFPRPGTTFREAEMRREEPPEGTADCPDGALDKTSVLLAIGLGLKATRTEAAAAPSGRSVRTVKVLRKAQVL